MHMPAHAQSQPVVVFLVGREVNSASYADVTATGLSKLADILIAYGADVQLLETGRPIPKSADLVVLARPLSTMTPAQAARLWVHLRRGKHLLLAVDPDNYFLGYANANPRITNTPLQGLFATDYGIIMRNSFVVDPWFTSATIIDIQQTFSQTFPEVIPNPITDPLIDHELSVRVWGARHMEVEPFGINNFAIPLIYNENGYGETQTDVFLRVRGRRLTQASEQLEINLDVDPVGRLQLGAMGVNTETGSRIVVLGDSELLTNGFGLAGTPLNPRYPANRIFVERTLAWLLDLPLSSWPSLPGGYTWIAIDGDTSEWQQVSGAAVFTGGAFNPETGITELRAFRDNFYAYLSVNVDVDPDVQVTIKSRLSEDAPVIIAQQDEVIVQDAEGSTVVPDANMAVGRGIELRLPLRVLPNDPVFREVCLLEGAEEVCITVTIPVYRVGLFAPYDLSLSAGMVAAVTSTGTGDVNLRAGPSTDTSVVGFIPNGTVFAADGRNEDASWIHVQNALYSGWMADFLLAPNGDFSYLPVIGDS